MYGKVSISKSISSVGGRLVTFECDHAMFIVSKHIVLFIPVTMLTKNLNCQYFMKACITFIFILCVICNMCSKWPGADLLKSPPAHNTICLAHWQSNATLCAVLHLYRCADCFEWFGTGSFSKLESWM